MVNEKTLESVINLIIYTKERRELKGEIGRVDAQYIADEVGLDMDQLVFLLAGEFFYKEIQYRNMMQTIAEQGRKIDTLEESIDEIIERKQQKQAILVKNGKHIKGRKGSISEVDLMMAMGYTDKEMMEDLGISRTTLWRYKKEIKAYHDKLRIKYNMDVWTFKSR